MRLTVSLAVVCLVVLVVPTTAGSDVEKVEKVKEALERASRIRTLRRRMDIFHSRSLSSSSEGCPLAKHHGKRGSQNVQKDRRTNDAIAAAQLLLKEGFTTEDLADETVSRELKRQLDCQDVPEVQCTTGAKYRSLDGSCNNIRQPSWGMAGTAQMRTLPAEYQDGISLPRANGVSGTPLPNPRVISNKVHTASPGSEVASQGITLHTFQMGQFLDHDIIKTPVISEFQDCCSSSDPSECLPIRIVTPTDPNPLFTEGYCMNFVRSAPLFCGQRREQINAITSYVDASNVYGSSEEELHELRDGTSPFMKTAPGNRLPNNPNPNACIATQTTAQSFNCSLAGDERANETPTLTTYHTMFVREHNRIAGELRNFFPDDEVLFQETRKIVIAVMQKIVYDEYLPSFLSKSAIKRHQLGSKSEYQYEETTDPSISNGFGITYRMGHTWIPRDMSLLDRNFELFKRVPTDETFFRPDLTYDNSDPKGFDALALGLLGLNSAATDRVIEEAARSRLFNDGKVSFDLAALNIQRGRDHGLPSFTTYRTQCNPRASKLENWNDEAVNEVFGPFNAQLLRNAGYQSPRDVDLFTGIISELSNPFGDLGFVAECIIGRQFRALKYGDRFWYQGQDAGFTKDQIKQIRKMSMSRILCDNFDFERINYPSVFTLGSTGRRPCKKVPAADLTVFANNFATGLPVVPEEVVEELLRELEEEEELEDEWELEAEEEEE